MQTNWPYDVTAATIPPLLTVEQFDVLGGSSLTASQERKAATIAAVSQAVRDYCGWHVSPVIACELTTNGNGNVLYMPVMAVRSVSALEIDGQSVTDYQWTRAGLLKLNGATFPDKWRSVKVNFTAGYPSNEAIGQIVAQITTNNLVAAAGLREEHAGQVGATYNQTDNGVSGGVRLLNSDRELLAPYRVI